MLLQFEFLVALVNVCNSNTIYILKQNLKAMAIKHLLLSEIMSRIFNLAYQKTSACMDFTINIL
jgi:hypothetical protein